MRKDLFPIGLKNNFLDIGKAKQEVRPFIKDIYQLNFWTKDYFKMLAD